MLYDKNQTNKPQKTEVQESLNNLTEARGLENSSPGSILLAELNETEMVYYPVETRDMRNISAVQNPDQD